MNRNHLLGERLVALFLLAVLLFNPPLLSIFDGAGAVGQVPTLYLYLFAVWGLLIALMMLVIEFAPIPPDDEPMAEKSAHGSAGDGAEGG